MNKLWFLLTVFFFCGCHSSGPVISKSNQGNLEINILGLESEELARVEVFVDELAVGNLSSARPILYLKKGEHEIAVQYKKKTLSKEIFVLGEPNHQVLNFEFKKKSKSKNKNEKKVKSKKKSKK